MRQILLAALAALALAGCVDNRSSIEIQGRAAPSDPKLCTFAPGGLRLFGPGTYDVQLAATTGIQAYGVALYVQNNLTDPANVSPGSVTSTKAWRAESVKVRLNPKEYVDANGAAPALPAVTGENILGLDGQVVEPGGGQDVQFVDFFSDGLAQSLAGIAPTTGSVRVIVGVTLQGRTLDGARLDTGEWYYPVDVCAGCLSGTAVCTSGTTPTANTCAALAQVGVSICQ